MKVYRRCEVRSRKVFGLEGEEEVISVRLLCFCMLFGWCVTFELAPS